MVKRMMKLLWVGGAILLAVGGTAMASNMGFKFVPNLVDVDPLIYDISIPINNNYVDLKSIFDDIAASVCTPGGVTVFDPAQNLCAWTGPFSCNTPYVDGQGIRVSVAGASCATWVIVGSHNPAFAFNLATIDPDIYDIAVPYHTTTTDLKSLFSEIPGAAGVTVFDTSQNICSWTGAFSCNTPIVIGTGYRVSVTAPVLYTASHY